MFGSSARLLDSPFPALVRCLAFRGIPPYPARPRAVRIEGSPSSARPSLAPHRPCSRAVRVVCLVMERRTCTRMNGQPETLTEQDTPRTPAPGLGWEEFSRELVEFFASIKLAMFLFLFIAITATIGTVIQQGERPETYIQEYGEEAYRWFLRSGLHRRLSHLVVHQPSRAPLRQLADLFLQALSRRLAIDETGQGQRLAGLHQGDEAAGRSDLCPAPRNRLRSSWRNTTSRRAIACWPKTRRGEVTLYATKGVIGTGGRAHGAPERDRHRARRVCSAATMDSRNSVSAWKARPITSRAATSI